MIFLKIKKLSVNCCVTYNFSYSRNYDIILIILKEYINVKTHTFATCCKISVIFAAAFFIINYIGMEKPDILYLVGRTIIATLAFILIVLQYLLLLILQSARLNSVRLYRCINYWYHFRRHIFNGTNRCHHWVNHQLMLRLFGN